MTTREIIFHKLRTHKEELFGLGIQNIGLFGSYVRNEQSLNSDIDVIIDFVPEQENFDNLMAAYDLVENLFLGEQVEIVTKNGLSPHFAPAILNEVVYV